MNSDLFSLLKGKGVTQYSSLLSSRWKIQEFQSEKYVTTVMKAEIKHVRLQDKA